ncbi:MAG: DapH/DapD/GlmU-related protein [Bacilli bacterium]|nr:DapH/DapD/GlmU-related protein [Bacilli bacterium]MDD4808787.1 DapH/DapD/GlmU-related protein [Bacilli bacterium]
MKLIDKNNTYIEDGVMIGDNTTIYPNVVIEGTTIIGDNCTIYSGSVIKDSKIGHNNVIYSSYIMDSEIGNNNEIGPYANIRSHNIIRNNIKVGAFVELKKCEINDHSKIPHLSYLGDAKVGSNVNVGCGVITANYDGKNKHQTVIKDNVFIGCNSNLVAPLTLHDGCFIGAGSTVTDDVYENQLCLARSRQVNKEMK